MAAPRQVVEQTITHGRHGVMPAWKDILGKTRYICSPPTFTVCPTTIGKISSNM